MNFRTTPAFLLLLLLNGPFALAQKEDAVTPAQYQNSAHGYIQHLAKNIGSPQSSSFNGKTGAVYVSFIIDTVGQLDSVWIVAGLDQEVDDEVVRVIQEMGQWKPATQNGKPIMYQINQPIGVSSIEGSDFSTDSDVFPPPTRKKIHAETMGELQIVQTPIRPLSSIAASENGKIIQTTLNSIRFDLDFEEGKIALEKGQYKEAVRFFTLSYRRDPENEEIIFNLGLAKHKAGNTKAACRHWKRAAKLGFEEATVWLESTCSE